LSENYEYIINFEAPLDERIVLNAVEGDALFEPNKYIEKSVINAKGDIIVGNENAEPMRLPIGAPDYFPVVDPTQDRGYKFSNVIDGGTF